MKHEQEEGCAKADRIATAYAERYSWSDVEALKLYFRLELVNDTLRQIVAGLHEQTMPDAKGWSVAVLRALYMAPGNRLSHAEIGAETRVPAANVTYHVDVLQHAGYVRRIPHETDRRVTLVELTDEGRSMCDLLMPARTRFITDMAQCFSSSELVLFNQYIDRLQQSITRRVEERD